jgi:NitT/TauT family transport system permease protein
MMLYTLPRLALMPLFIVWFGIEEESKIALVVSLVVFVMLMNTYTGVRSVPVALVDEVRLMGGKTKDVIRHVYLQATLPWIITGVRISLVFALAGAIVGEMFAAKYGLGYLMTRYSNLFRSDGMVALLAIIAVVAIVLNGLLTLAERRLVFWTNANDD